MAGGIWSHHDSTDRRICRFPFSFPSLGMKAKSVGVYLSGGLFALSLWVFIDSAIYSKVASGSDVHITFTDWIPLICSVLGMIVINSIDKGRLSGENYAYSSTSQQWQARLILFLGFALIAGGWAGSVVVHVLKYVIPEYPFPTLWFGYSNIVSNSLIMLR